MPFTKEEVRMTKLNEAIRLAAELHDGQTDKAGVPYILHTLRLMVRVKIGDEASEGMMIAAALHDVVEDCNVRLEYLRAEFGDAVADTIDAISRRDGEDYEVYIDRVALNPVARRLKILDLMDNLDPTRASTGILPMGTIAKYRCSLARLIDGKWPGETEERSGANPVESCRKLTPKKF